MKYFSRATLDHPKANPRLAFEHPLGHASGRCKFVGLLVALGMAMIWISPASAQTSIVQTQSTPFVNTSTSNTTNLTFNAFDPSLGTLTGVAVSIASEISDASISIQNNTSSPQTVEVAGENVEFSLTGPLISVSFGDEVLVSQTTQVQPGSTDFTDGTLSLYPEANSGTISSELFDLSAYEGSPGQTVSLNLVISPISYIGSSPDVAVGGQAMVNSTTTVTYLYDAVPEPSTWVLMSGGCLLFLGQSRIRRMLI